MGGFAVSRLSSQEPTPRESGGGPCPVLLSETVRWVRPHRLKWAPSLSLPVVIACSEAVAVPLTEPVDMA